MPVLQTPWLEIANIFKQMAILLHITFTLDVRVCCKYFKFSNIEAKMLRTTVVNYKKQAKIFFCTTFNELNISEFEILPFFYVLGNQYLIYSLHKGKIRLWCSIPIKVLPINYKYCLTIDLTFDIFAMISVLLIPWHEIGNIFKEISILQE